MSEVYEFPAPERVSFGTIGPQGQRVFYLQVREGQQLFTVKLEKQQVGALSLHLGQLLQDLVRPGHLPEEEGARRLEPFSRIPCVRRRRDRCRLRRGGRSTGDARRARERVDEDDEGGREAWG